MRARRPRDASTRRFASAGSQRGHRAPRSASTGRPFYNYSRSAENAGAERQVGSDADPCRDNNWGDRDYERHCEVRDSTMPAGPLNVDAGQNGGISIEGWDRNEIRVRAIVQTSARDASDARSLAGQVQVQAGGGRVYATGPDSGSREWWSVSYRINVPHKNDLDLRASNGGITIVGVTGNMRFDTTNGGVRLQDVGGRVNGETRNGGLNVTLSGIALGRRRPRRRDQQRRRQPRDSRRLQRRARDAHGQRRPAHRLPDHGAGRADVAPRPQHHARIRRPARARAHDQRRRDDQADAN